MKKSNIQIILSVVAILISIAAIFFVSIHNSSMTETEENETKHNIENETKAVSRDGVYSKFNDTTVVVSAGPNFLYALFRLTTSDAECADAFALFGTNAYDNFDTFIIYNGNARQMYCFISCMEQFARNAKYDSEMMELNEQFVFMRKCKPKLKGVAIIKGIRQDNIKHKILEDDEIAKIKKDFVAYCKQYHIEYI